MLTTLSRLSVQTDGRYATEKELGFLSSYLNSVEIRTSAYQKLLANVPEIIKEAERKIKKIDPKIFINSGGDFTERWQKDTIVLMRYIATTLLFGDQERLQEGLLLWHNTIARSYQFDHACKKVFEIMPEVVEKYLTPEEMKLVKPLLSLNAISLG